MSILLSPEEANRIKELKIQKRFPWREDAFDQYARDRAARNYAPSPPRRHLIILQTPLETPRKIEQVAGLSETPDVSQARVILERTGGEEVVNFCCVGDKGLLAIYSWLDQNQSYYLEPTNVAFEGERKPAFKPVTNAQMAG
ncbi:MAG: hypothetical protein M1813_004823 [Trichoglossum hirsutum]|nr:MAG: hypothetical protein M1813_004823 [Trichoglossum hirsutum]